MRFMIVVALSLLWSISAAGVEEVWRYDLGCGLPNLPVAMSYAGQPGKCLYVSSRLSNTIEVVGADGHLVSTYARPDRVAGGIACNSMLDQLLFNEGDRSFVLFNVLRPDNFVAESDAETGTGVGLLFADMDGDDLAEVLSAGADGTLCVYDRRLSPKWEYDAGEPLAGGIGAGPVFDGCGGVYAVCRDGSVHGVSGEGEPLWRKELPGASFTESKYRRVLIVDQPAKGATVVVANISGHVYALGAGGGEVQWTLRAGTADAGTPAVLEDGYFVLCADGNFTRVGWSGEVISHGQLPPGPYVPLPLVADFDGDGEEEFAAATLDRRVIISTFQGRVKETLNLPGNASQGLILPDINEAPGKDKFLNLMAVTDCGRVICYKTLARGGWTHPAGNAAMNGFVDRRGGAHDKPGLPELKRAGRSARVESVTVRDFVQDSWFGTLFLRARLPKKSETASVVIRRNGKIVGSTCKRVGRDGFYVPFVQASSEPLALDLDLYNHDGQAVASKSDVAVLSGPVKLVELAPIDEFLQAVNANGSEFSVPQNWSVPYKPGPTEDSANAASLSDGQSCEGTQPSLYAPLQFAMLRGKSREVGGESWGAIMPADTARPAGVSRDLDKRLELAAWLSGAAFIKGGTGVDGGDRGTPYTPLAFMVPPAAGDKAGGATMNRGELATTAMLRHVYGGGNADDAYSGSLTSGPYGDIFDIVAIGDDLAGHSAYGVVWPLGDFDIEKAQAKSLVDYVQNGGILVVDAALALRLRNFVPGIQFSGKMGIGTQVQTALDDTAPVHAPYRYHIMAAGNKRVLAWTDLGRPLIIWRPIGKGLLIIGTTDHWTDETNRLLPVAEALLHILADAFTPVQVPQGFEVILNRVPDGWIVGAFNNRPELKIVAGASVLDSGASECLIRWKKGAPQRFMPQLGDFSWNNTVHGLTTMLRPGEAAVVRVTLPE